MTVLLHRLEPDHARSIRRGRSWRSSSAVRSRPRRARDILKGRIVRVGAEIEPFFALSIQRLQVQVPSSPSGGYELGRVRGVGRFTRDAAMDENSRQVAVWLHDNHARLIVGAAPANNPSRWAIQGTMVGESGVGLWLRTKTIQEFRPTTIGTKQVNWQFASTELLVRWDAVITIQVFESSGKEIGFRPATQ